MKLRLRGNSLRLRLRQPEVLSLASGLAVEDATVLGPDPSAKFVCRVVAAEVGAIVPQFEHGVLTVSIPRSMAVSWSSGDDVGLYLETEWGLRIAIEKDFRCLEPRGGEDDSGAFERPDGYQPDPCAVDEG